MNLTFINRMFRDPMAALAAAQGVVGVVQAVSGSNKIKKLRQRLEPYRTPEEVYDVLKATKNASQFGYDSTTLNYLTGQTEKTFAQSIGSAERLGADPNTLSLLFNQKMDNIVKIGADNHALNMQNFSNYLAALGTVAENKAAEQKSEQDLLKDEIQSAATDKQAGFQNIFGAINAGIAISNANKMEDLFKDGRTGGNESLAFGNGITLEDVMRARKNNFNTKGLFK